MTHRTRLAAALTAGALLLTACSGDDPEEASSDPTETPTSASATDDPEAGVAEPPAPDEAALDLAVSEPREDSYYPEVGDPGVDALHYGLSLHWDPVGLLLTGRERLTFRAAETADEFQLDFGEPLEVTELTVDGEAAEWSEDGKDLVISHPVEADQRYVVELSYSGLPDPVDAPVQRHDFSRTGWTVTQAGETWTMQEPYGAFTWYAVNDHPSDKALYDFTLTVPAPWTGVANGEMREVTDSEGLRTTQWHLAEPAASYLVTTAFGDFDMTRARSASGVPITYWTPRSKPRILNKLKVTTRALTWLEDLLGPYPFDTFGTVVVDSESGMETQTMVTLGDTSYTLSSAVITHELAHQWWGDQVTPNDWRDVWMNEGMVMYLQGMWEAEEEGISVAAKMDEWAAFEEALRAEAGPPAAYLPDSFGSSNIYYGPALMYQELREMVGDEKFFEVVRGWPAANDNGNVGREEIFAYLEKTTGEELSAFLDDWLLGETTPPRD